VEQIGTDSDCSNGSPSYYAWYEFYPDDAYYAPGLMNLHPGDVMAALIFYNFNGTFTATIVDETTRASYTTTFTPNGLTGTPQRSSAEWIAEAPCCSNQGGVLPLADFGVINFGQDTTDIIGTNSAAANGGGLTVIGGFPSNYVWTSKMVNENAPSPPTPLPPADVMAVPSGLSPDGSSFSVTWYSVGP
jgi:hypothetical protein